MSHFSKLDMITIEGEKITIEGKDIIDNADMFKRALTILFKLGTTYIKARNEVFIY